MPFDDKPDAKDKPRDPTYRDERSFERIDYCTAELASSMRAARDSPAMRQIVAELRKLAAGAKQAVLAAE